MKTLKGNEILIKAYRRKKSLSRIVYAMNNSISNNVTIDLPLKIGDVVVRIEGQYICIGAGIEYNLDGNQKKYKLKERDRRDLLLTFFKRSVSTEIPRSGEEGVWTGFFYTDKKIHIPIGHSSNILHIPAIFGYDPKTRNGLLIDLIIRTDWVNYFITGLEFNIRKPLSGQKFYVFGQAQYNNKDFLEIIVYGLIGIQDEGIDLEKDNIQQQLQEMQESDNLRDNPRWWYID